ncbi:helix-turn-helix domain-containing protein [Sinorhizobium meliloti]|nr:helix-turn-helix domain-containing protein [Sinorhizobium meliloti]
MKESLGKVIRAARQLRKMTQGDLAEFLNVTRGAVAQYESDTITPPVLALKRLCGHLRIDLGDAVNGILTPSEGKGMRPRDISWNDDPEAAALFERIAGLVEKEVLFRPSAVQTLIWLSRKAGIGEQVLENERVNAYPEAPLAKARPLVTDP